ncbi:MAG TPA: hypothetical protein VG077_02430, partial [Verrucomicrobiae bacterium]|nr:hypothetical protein [Verrucomicrobiae bacterium]
TQTLGDRMVLALHDGNLTAAWTNLFATTRLVTAWQTEPIEISELIRFGNTALAYNTTWQAFQTNGWSDEQLARLQKEWESVDLFTNLPETAAFKRAREVALCQQDRQEFLEFRPTYKLFLIGSLQSPRDMWYGLLSLQSERDYLRHGMYEDQTDLLLFYHDRELELRRALQAPNWAVMRRLPGVTNLSRLQTKHSSRIQAALNLHEIGLRFQRRGSSFLARAAEAEAERRILITAIALERYRGEYGSYPDTLAKLAPEFLKAVPADFMDGYPLRYRLANEGHFSLYSVGLNCADDGGKFPTRPKGAQDWQAGPGNAHLLGTDILWPLPD